MTQQHGPSTQISAALSKCTPFSSAKVGPQEARDNLQANVFLKVLLTAVEEGTFSNIVSLLLQQTNQQFNQDWNCIEYVFYYACNFHTRMAYDIQ